MVSIGMDSVGSELMAPWADLPSDLLGRVVDNLDLKCYVRSRGVCPAWRRSLAPPIPAILVFARNEGHFSRSRRPYVASLLACRSFELMHTVANESRSVGCCSGWIAISVAPYDGYSLLNPGTAAEVILPPLVVEMDCFLWVSKVVFAPNPSRHDFAAAAICGVDLIAYITAGPLGWVLLDPVPLAAGDRFIDLLYQDPGMVYCLTERGVVYVLRLPERKAPTVEGSGPSQPEFPILRLLQHITPWHFRTHLSKIPLLDKMFDMFRRLSAYSPAWILNTPGTIKPLLSRSTFPFLGAAAFSPTYEKLSHFTGAKYLVFCQGNLYQVWRNAGCTVILSLPEGGKRRLPENEILVFRYYPYRWPRWNVVKDLGGYSFFVGKNNAVSMYAGDVPGLRGNCVYWIGGQGRDQAMVFDVETGRTERCQSPPIATVPGQLQSIICWYS